MTGFVFRPFWGSYELRPAPPHGLGFRRIWHPNKRLQMSEAEQEAANTANHADFCREKYLPPAVRLSYG